MATHGPLNVARTAPPTGGRQVPAEIQRNIDKLNAFTAEQTNAVLITSFHLLKDNRTADQATRLAWAVLIDELGHRHPAIEAALDAWVENDDPDLTDADVVELFLGDLDPDATGRAPWICHACDGRVDPTLHVCPDCVVVTPKMPAEVAP